MALSSEPSPRKALGAFYTPPNVARSIVDWALAGVPGSVLDPSFGGCSFLDQAIDALASLGALHPGRLVHGIDVDGQATAEPARRLVTRGVPEEQLVIRDFFAIAAAPR